jgi:hypothetical protein
MNVVVRPTVVTCSIFKQYLAYPLAFNIPMQRQIIDVIHAHPEGLTIKVRELTLLFKANMPVGNI